VLYFKTIKLIRINNFSYWNSLWVGFSLKISNSWSFIKERSCVVRFVVCQYGISR